MNTEVNEKVANAMGWKGVLDFSGDISAAWHVVKRMRAKGYKLKLQDCTMLGEIETFGDQLWLWEARFITVHKSPSVLFGEAPEAPMAICLAALSSKGRKS